MPSVLETEYIVVTRCSNLTAACCILHQQGNFYTYHFAALLTFKNNAAYSTVYT